MNSSSSQRYASNLSFLVMFYQLFGGHAMQVTKPGLHHDGKLTQRLFDDTFGDAVDRPADVRLW